MANDLLLAVRLLFDSKRWTQGLSQARSSTKAFADGAKRELGHLRNTVDGVTGRLAAMGAGFSAVQQIMKSARTDQQLTMIKQTAELSADQTKRLRVELKAMSAETGVAFEALTQGFGGLVAGGMNFDQALPTIDAINKTVRVTQSEVTTLTQALQMAQSHFEFDLSKPGEAQLRLDQMVVAARAGVVELEDLSQAFAGSAANAKRAGLSFEETLAVYEAFGTATTKDRLGTLVNSTLAVFTNANYMREAQKATGVSFFDANGERRGAIDVITDIKKEYDKLTTDKDRFRFISKAFGKADKDTIIGINEALKEGTLDQIQEIVERVRSGSGIVEQDLGETMNNAVAQANVLRERMGAAADEFAQPINDVFTKVAKFALDKKSEGGLEMSGGQIAAASAAAIAALYAGGRLGKGLLGKASESAADLGAGLAAGLALEKAGLATPVFIVGAAPGIFTGMTPSIPDTAPPAGPASNEDGSDKKRKTNGPGKNRITGGRVVGPLALAAIAADLASGPQPEVNLADYGLEDREGKGFDWLKRGGLPILNLVQDIREALRSVLDERKAENMQLDLNLNVQGGVATVTSHRGDVDANVRSSFRPRIPNLGQMMRSPGIQ